MCGPVEETENPWLQIYLALTFLEIWCSHVSRPLFHLKEQISVQIFVFSWSLYAGICLYSFLIYTSILSWFISTLLAVSQMNSPLTSVPLKVPFLLSSRELFLTTVSSVSLIRDKNLYPYFCKAAVTVSIVKSEEAPTFLTCCYGDMGHIRERGSGRKIQFFGTDLYFTLTLISFTFELWVLKIRVDATLVLIFASLCKAQT